MIADINPCGDELSQCL